MRDFKFNKQSSREVNTNFRHKKEEVNNNNLMMSHQLLLSFFIIFSVLPTITSPSSTSSYSNQFQSRVLSQRIIDQQNKKVQKIIKHKTYFQSYHFSLKYNEKYIEFYLDPLTEEQIEGYVSIMWKQNNVFLQGIVLESEKLRLEIYENEGRIFKKSFYTKVSFRFFAKQHKLYRMRISHKNQSPIVCKLVTLNVEYFFELFEQHRNEDDSQESENNLTQLFIEQVNNNNNKIVQQSFDLRMLSSRLRGFLNGIKLLINSAETKHMAEYSVEKFISRSVDIYWWYQLFECGLVMFCAFIQIAMVNKLLTSDRILV